MRAAHVIDMRNLGIDRRHRAGVVRARPGDAASTCLLECFEAGLLIRITGDIIALSPPLIIEKAEIDRLFGTLPTFCAPGQ